MPLRIIFMGTPEFARPTLEFLVSAGHKPELVVCQPDRPQGRRREVIPSPVKATCTDLHLPVLQPERVRCRAFYDELATIDPDLIITAAYGRILSREVLALPKLGCINLHPSLLPRYRGAAPVQHSIINGDTETGVSVLFMTDEVDAGDILAQKRVSLPEDITAGELLNDLAVLGARMVLEVVEAIAAGHAQAYPQDPALVTYAPPLTSSSGHIDWTRSSIEIHNLIRGTQPWPEAVTEFNGKRVIIKSAAVADSKNKYGRPGEVVFRSKRRLLVACGQGLLEVFTLQTAGGRPLSASETAHNYRGGTFTVRVN
ncbi:MAG: methionyl-tRNA formyltransferase [Clostridiaceae bacterium]|nr:methionyl-tRNA formyltransferase [Clostridiaceae bacterium]